MPRSGFPKHWLAIFGITLLVLLLVSPSALAAQTGAITLQVAPFFNGHYKYGEWLPLRVTVTNPGAALDAQVRVDLSQSGGDTTWLVPVQLPTGAQKQLTLYVLPPSFAQIARVRVLNGTQELAKQDAPLTTHPNTEFLVGVIAPRTESFNPISGMVLTGDVPRTVRMLPLTLNDLPERTEGLGALDALVVTDTDTSALSPAQTRALSSWVQQGGRLVLGGGASAARTLSGLPDALAADFRAPDGVTELSALEALGTFADQEVRVPGPFVAAFGAGGDALVKQDDRALIAEKRVGDGHVTYSALDLAASPFDAWAGTLSYWKEILQPNSAYPINTPVDVSPDLIRTRYMAMALQNLPVLALPSINVLTALLIAYIVLVGPVNYLVLRRMKKLDWGWLTIPVLTLLFAVGAFGISNQLRGSDVILNQVSVVEFATDGAAREMETVVGLYSPTRGSFNVEIPAGGLVVPILDQMEPFSSGGGGARSDVEIVESNPLLVRGVEINQGALQTLAIQSPPPEWQIESDLTIEGDHVRGTIVNRTTVPLSDAVLTMGNRYLQLDTLQPNQPVTLDKAWLSFAGQIPDLFGGGTTSAEARRQILNARFDYWRGAANAPSAALLIGWTDTSALDVQVQNTNAARETKTLVIAPLNIHYLPGMIQFGVTDWQVDAVGGTGERTNCGPLNYSGVRKGDLVLKYQSPSSVRIKNVKKLSLVIREQYPQTIELQDVKGNWVPLDVKEMGTHEIQNPGEYIQADGSLRLRLSSEEMVDRCTFYSFEMEAEVEE